MDAESLMSESDASTRSGGRQVLDGGAAKYSEILSRQRRGMVNIGKF